LDRQKRALNRRAFQRAARLVTWSEWARRSLVDDYGVDDARIRVLPPGAAAGFFELGARRLATPPRLKCSGRAVRLLFVGNDFKRKGGEQLLASLGEPLGCRWRLDLVTNAAIEPRANVQVHRDLAPNSTELLRLFDQAD